MLPGERIPQTNHEADHEEPDPKQKYEVVAVVRARGRIGRSYRSLFE